MSNWLNQINNPVDLHRLNDEQLVELAQELREAIIKTVAQNGGHLAPNLGVVELTLALHLSFDSPRDQIVWDVGHQSYVHKLLTGRRQAFPTLRQWGGLSGFPKPGESPHDAFATGHSSTSLSAALGLALGRDLLGDDNQVVAVIGDGALTGGMALEALNHAGHLGTHLVVVLNDNEMSIDLNVGAMASYLSRLRTDPIYYRGKEEVETLLRKLPAIGPRVVRIAERLKDSLKYMMVPGMIFEELGFTYLGPIDGHNIAAIRPVLQRARALKGPVLVHVRTVKGKGYQPAVAAPGKFHGIGPFDVTSGQTRASATVPSYTEVFGRELVRLAADDPRIVAITAAMPEGTGLHHFAHQFPARYVDVGIAEQHAVTLAAALATKGLRPVVAIYSTFAQRAYDQLVHDVGLQNLPVLLCLDRAGLVGEDGETHQGLLDLAYLRTIPGMTIMAPKDEQELRDMMLTGLSHAGPAAIRYPRGSGVGVSMATEPQVLTVGKGEMLQQGDDIGLLVIGPLVYAALEAARTLAAEGLNIAVANCRFVKPLDDELILRMARQAKLLVTVEEHSLAGGFGSAVLELLAAKGLTVPVVNIGIPDQFVPHGPVATLRQHYGLTPAGLANKIKQSASRLVVRRA